MEFRAVPNRVNQPSLQEKFGENKFALIAYHAQQCAEKCIKAYLVFHNIDFPYTHNIRKLLRICGEDTFSALKEAEELTPFAVTTRYPGLDDEVTKEEAFFAIDLAKKVRQHIIKTFAEKNFII